ncbi:alpha/beta fold hydrolase [Legionella israelensis]|uniref:alpha/beta hydrolase n=1 Tax=Legionella israelensis TaxID=454 RepID=UPI00117EC102|nr:alpha/beta fold hydrolase [Legionella israelensis]QDP71649.1 alpha/beta fold hydrolase [Legionella israelensis]
MKRDDFRHMRRGRQIAALKDSDLRFLKPVHYIGKEKNHALLMLHGFSSSPAVFRYMLPHLLNYDAIIAPVLPGHMDTIDAFSRVKAMDWLMSAEKICASLLQDYKQVDLLGFSLGGLIACYLSERFPFHRLYLFAPALALRLHVKAILKLARAFRWLGFCQVRNAAGNLLHEEHTEIAYRRLPLESIKELFVLIDEFRWQPPEYPIELFLGCHDIVVDNHKVSAFFSSLPNANIHWLKNSAHVLPMDNDFEEIIQYMNDQVQQPLLPMIK